VRRFDGLIGSHGRWEAGKQCSRIKQILNLCWSHPAQVVFWASVAGMMLVSCQLFSVIGGSPGPQVG
jgi:hypothetical protein